MGFSLKNLARGIKDDLNLWDKGKSHGNNQTNRPPPASTAQPKSSFKPFDNSLTRGLSRGYDQANIFDNNRTWQHTTPTNNRSVSSMLKAAPKAIIKPFYEAADYGRNSAQLGVANTLDKFGVEGASDYANKQRQARDQSFQQSALYQPNRALNAIKETPIGRLIPGVAQQQDTQRIMDEKQIQGADTISELSRQKAIEIKQGIDKGIYDPNKGNEVIQQLLEQDTAASQMKQDIYNRKLSKIDIDQNTSPGRIFAQTAGDLLTTAGYFIAPTSGAALRQLPQQAFKKAALTNIGTNAVLGGSGMGLSTYGQGGSIEDSLKAFGTGAGITTALVGAGYAKNVPKNVTTKLVNNKTPLGQSGHIKNPFYQENPNFKINAGDTLIGKAQGPIDSPIKISNNTGQFFEKGIQPKTFNVKSSVPLKKGIKSILHEEVNTIKTKRPVVGVAKQSQLSKQASSEGFGNFKSANPAKAKAEYEATVGKRPQADLQLKIEKAHNTGNTKLAAQLESQLNDKGLNPDAIKPKSKPSIFGDQSGKALLKDEGSFIPTIKKLVSKNKELPIVGKKQSGFAKSVAKSNEISPELQAKVKKADVKYNAVKNADQIKVSEKLIKGGYKKAATDVTSRLEKKLGKIDDQDVVDTIHVIKELDKRGGEANLQQATNLSEKLSQHLTKQGQSIQASSILNNRTPEGMAYGARKFLKGHDVKVTPEIQKVIKSNVDEIAKMKNGEARSYKIAEFQQTISQYVPSSALEKGVGLWKAGLLTGIKTQTGNTLSGVATNVLKTISDVPAAALDTGFAALGKTKFGKSLGFTGERSKSFTLRGKGSGAAEGLKKGVKSLKTGVDERNMEAAKFDTKRLVFSKKPLGRAAQKYTDTVYGLMGAADRPNYYSNLRNNLYDLAITDAKNKGLKGSLREAHIQKFIKEPPMKALETANHAAETAIFANDTALSKIASGVIKKAEDAGPVVGTAAKVALPFTKVPSAVATRLIDYSPLGAVKTLAFEIKNVKKGQGINQRALSEGLAQAGVGTGTMYIGMQLHEKGLMTGSYPTDQKERELWKLEGKQPNSIKVGNKWLSFNYTSPVGQILAVGGKIDEAKQKGGSASDQATAGVFAIPKTVSEQSFLQGVNGIQDAINDPEKQGSKFIKNQGSSVIPTLSADIAKATDPLQRQSNNMKEATQAKIPWANKKLLPKQDAFGAPLPRQSSSTNALVNPFRPSDVRPTNDLNTELRRLQDQKLGVMPDPTDKQLKIGKETITLTPQQLFDKNSTRGKKVQDTWNAIIKSPEYQKMTDEQKQKALSNSLSDFNALSKGEYASKNNPELLDSLKLNKNQIKLSQGDASKYLKTSSTTNSSSISDDKMYNYRKVSSQASLDMSRALSNNNISQYMSAAKSELDALEKLKKSYDPKTEQDKINSTIKKQEALINKVNSYNSKGYLKKTAKGKSTKGSKAKKGKFNYSKRLISGTASSTALRNLVKGIKINRKRITK